MKTKTIIFLILITVTACKPRNKLNTNEQKLAAEIKTEEQEKQAAEEPLMQNQISIPDTLPPGLGFNEDRSVDSKFPPKTIDVANLFNNKKSYKLSDLISNIEYIPLEDIPGDNHGILTEHTPFLTDNYLAIRDQGSLYLFNRDGTFRDVIYESIEEGGKTSHENSAGVTVNTSAGLTKGVFLDVWDIGNLLYFTYLDFKTEKYLLMRYDMDSPENNISVPTHNERAQSTVKGEIYAKLSPKRKERYTEYVPLSNDSYVGINRKVFSAKDGNLMTSFRLNGDTLTFFPDYETVTNFSHRAMRGNFSQLMYQYGKAFTFRNAFNDTVYRVIPPNRLIPVYVFNMGDYKIQTQEGLTPGQDISQKLYIKSFTETTKYIYLNLISGYDSYNNRAKKGIKVYYAIYEKLKGQLFLLPINPMSYYGITDGVQNIYFQRGVINDIDGGLIFWPKKVSPKGEVYEVVTGEKLKMHVNSEEFINSLAPKNKKEELKKLAEKVGKDQLVLVVYKKK